MDEIKNSIKKIMKWIDSTQQVVELQSRQIEELKEIVFLILDKIPGSSELQSKINLIKMKQLDNSHSERRVEKIH